MMELHRVARPADVSVVAHEGAAPVVSIVDLAVYGGWDVLTLYRHTGPRFHDHNVGHE
jgi:hypothetical protein